MRRRTKRDFDQMVLRQCFRAISGKGEEGIGPRWITGLITVACSCFLRHRATFREIRPELLVLLDDDAPIEYFGCPLSCGLAHRCAQVRALNQGLVCLRT